jgi:hypothetical protein
MKESAMVCAFAASAANAFSRGEITGFYVRSSPELIEVMIEKASPLLCDKNAIVQARVERATVPSDPKAAKAQAARMFLLMSNKLESEYLRRVRGGEVPA